MGAYDTDLPKLKVPGMENPPAATPQPTTDPMAGLKKQFADLASTAQAVGQTMSAPAPKPAPRPVARSYKVARGDTLGRIASRFQCEVPALARANGLRAPAYALKPGQTLKLEGCRR